MMDVQAASSGGAAERSTLVAAASCSSVEVWRVLFGPDLLRGNRRAASLRGTHPCPVDYKCRGLGCSPNASGI